MILPVEGSVYMARALDGARDVDVIRVLFKLTILCCADNALEK
jgi:hypothetical protein